MYYESVPFESKNGSLEEPSDNTSSTESSEKRKNSTMIFTLFNIFKNRSVLIWSIWWAIASCGTFQVKSLEN